MLWSHENLLTYISSQHEIIGISNYNFLKLQRTCDVNDRDKKNQSNAGSNDQEAKTPGENDDNKTRNIAEGGETESQALQV